MASFAGAEFKGAAHLTERPYPKLTTRFFGHVIKHVFLQPPVFQNQGRLHLGDNRTGFAKFRQPESGEAAFRTAKQHAQAAGDYLLAGDYHYAERVYRSRRRMWYNPLRWLENIFVRGVFGYGERPLRILITAGVIILAWALLFLFCGIQENVGATSVEINRQLSIDPAQVVPTIKDFLRCLYFSAISFATVGYGDFQPTGLSSRLFAVIEGLSGIVLAALFVVTVAKRFGRG